MLRKLYFALALIAIVSTKWAGVSYAAQHCCPRSVLSEAQEPSARTNAIAAMSSLNTDAVRKEFNISGDKVRIVALLSPTCPRCRSGHGVIGEVLKNFSSAKLQAILVWEPIQQGDNPEAAAQQALAVRDVRITQGLDADSEVGKLFGETLDLHDIAWDVYLAYEPGIKWEGRRPPVPTFWMHQLEGVDPKLLLCENPNRLSSELGKLLDQTK